MPGSQVDVAVDGAPVARSVAPRSVAGPWRLAAGQHTVTFTDTATGRALESTFTLEPGGSIDLVLHRPASPDAPDVVSVYDVPRQPIGPGRARAFVAHTAVVPPADVVVDGTTVFSNIANAEFAAADVPAGTHAVSIVPTGTEADPLLGPLEVTLDEGTISMIYAIGSPTDGSMDVVSHTLRLDARGSVAPDQIRTGTAGLVAGQSVRAFTDGAGTTPAPSGRDSWLVLTSLVAGAFLLLLVLLVRPVLRTSRPKHRAPR